MDKLKNKITGIILLAGNSTRYGKNKNFEELDNKLVFLYSLDVFNNNTYIDDIILVIRESDKEFIDNLLKKYHFNKNIKLVIGGSTRMESVYNALINTNSEIVVIHDAARPMIKDEYINNCIEAIEKYRGAIIAVKVKDTIKLTNDKGEIISSTNRVNTYMAQTPQVFYRDLLLKLHLKYKNNLTITDDSMLLEMDGYKIKIVNGDYTNIKLTTKDDLILAKEYIKTLKK